MPRIRCSSRAHAAIRCAAPHRAAPQRHSRRRSGRAARGAHCAAVRVAYRHTIIRRAARPLSRSASQCRAESVPARAQVCLWCFHRIKDDMNGKCPGPFSPMGTLAPVVLCISLRCIRCDEPPSAAVPPQPAEHLTSWRTSPSIKRPKTSTSSPACNVPACSRLALCGAHS